MRIVKLSAIPSTNDYLKNISQAENLENFTCVVADNQTAGRGQMGAQWEVVKGKNLTFSVYVEDAVINISEIYLLNVAVALSLFRILQNKKIPKLSVKWPNDIMADNKKIGGILIENTIKGDGAINSIIGIGLNVNQTNFENMPAASSMAIATIKNFDKDELLIEILTELEKNIITMNANSEKLWADYKLHLFKINIPMAFEKMDGQQLMGIIKDVNPQGLLVVEHEDDNEHYYNIKEIKMLY